METAATLPKQDQDLLATFIAVRFNLIELATHTRRPLLVLQDWALQPQIQAQIARYRSLEKLQHQTQAADARAAGINTLLDLLTESPDPIERRRAAQTLIRVGTDTPPQPDESDQPLSADEEFDRDLEQEDESNDLDHTDEAGEPDEADEADNAKPPTPPNPILSLTPEPTRTPPDIHPTLTLAPPRGPQSAHQNGHASATS